MIPSYQRLESRQRTICLAIGLFCIAMGLAQQVTLWQLDADGLSPVAERLPYWDFSNLWAGSVMALEGHTGLLFDPAAYREALDRILGVTLPHPQEWSYPPHILLIGVPLALMPIWLAYIVWSAGTLFLFHLALRPFRLPVLAHLFVLLSPAIWSNQVFGQNGALTAALLIGGLTLAPRKPILAGILIGFLTIKPHLGILLPFVLLAGWNIRAFISAAVTAVVLVLATGLLFGFDVWVGFLTETRALMTLIMEQPYPQAYHTHAATVFVTARSLGADLAMAYLVQGFATAIAVAAAIWLWRPAARIDHLSRVAMTGVLVIAATPYGYTHDTAPVYLAIAWFLLTDRKPQVAFFGALWVFAIFFPELHGPLGFSAGIVAPVALAAWLFYARWSEIGGGAIWRTTDRNAPEPATAS